LRTISGLLLAAIAVVTTQVHAQNDASPAAAAPLVLTGTIPLDNVHGRIDHFGFDPNNRLFVSALGNNTEEVVDLGAQRVVHTIAGIPAPQGVVFSPETNKLFVASTKGTLYVYDGSSFALLTTIDFHEDADNLRYDPAQKRVYVGYGEGETGAIGMVDATTNKRLDEDFKVGAHPESFQLEKKGPNIYVNLPGLKQIAIINRQTKTISRWNLTLGATFPMALDEPDHRIVIASRAPARMAVFNTESGKLVTALPCAHDADDLYYDSALKRIYVSGGEGYISVFQQKDGDQYESLAKIPSSVGARTSGYFGKVGKKGFDRLYVATPARANHGAEIRIYTAQD
jgi:hypothetical protein